MRMRAQRSSSVSSVAADSAISHAAISSASDSQRQAIAPPVCGRNRRCACASTSVAFSVRKASSGDGLPLATVRKIASSARRRSIAAAQTFFALVG